MCTYKEKYLKNTRKIPRKYLASNGIVCTKKLTNANTKKNIWCMYKMLRNAKGC